MRTPADLQNDMDFLDAQDALESCARAAAAGRQQGPMIEAMKKVNVTWDHAPKMKKYGKTRPEGMDQLREFFATPCANWLPYSDELGASQHTLLENGKPTQFCMLMTVSQR